MHYASLHFRARILLFRCLFIEINNFVFSYSRLMLSDTVRRFWSHFNVSCLQEWEISIYPACKWNIFRRTWLVVDNFRSFESDFWNISLLFSITGYVSTKSQHFGKEYYSHCDRNFVNNLYFLIYVKQNNNKMVGLWFSGWKLMISPTETVGTSNTIS